MRRRRAADKVARALADIQARCHVENGSAPEGARFARCLAHALAFMAAGAPGSYAVLFAYPNAKVLTTRDPCHK